MIRSAKESDFTVMRDRFRQIAPLDQEKREAVVRAREFRIELEGDRIERIRTFLGNLPHAPKG